MCRHRFHQRRVGCRERLTIRPAQKRQRAPRRVVVDEHRAQLIAETVRAHDLPVAFAAIEDAAGGLAERRRVALRQGERGERVEVFPAKLDLLQPRVRRRRRHVLGPPCLSASASPGPSWPRTRRRTASRGQGSELHRTRTRVRRRHDARARPGPRAHARVMSRLCSSLLLASVRGSTRPPVHPQ